MGPIKKRAVLLNESIASLAKVCLNTGEAFGTGGPLKNRRQIPTFPSHAIHQALYPDIFVDGRATFREGA